ncbi:MAG: hypothetical protein IVW36_11415, partial [Dehalococcoidia bacterium]|nr:hypothetical protein [Dehalococcoidia bacterium]
MDPYTGFEVNVIFDTTQFIYFGNDGAANGVFAGQQNLCLAAPSPQPSPPGEVVSCTPVGAPSNSAAGEFIQLQFTPTGSAVCSKFHLYTLNGPDNGDSNTGSYSIDYAAQQPQLNTFGPDITVNQAGAPGCTPPTNTPTATNTAAPTATNTAAPTATNTA